MEEKYIIYMAQKGDYDSFKVLYEKYYMKVYNFVYGKMKKKFDVEDIVQVTFLKVYKNLKYYDIEKGKFYNFILTNCKQVISDYYTKQIIRDNIVEEVRFDDNVVNDELIDYSEIGNDNYNITSAIHKLTEEQKEAFVLIYIKHIKQKEAAQIMGKSIASVKSLAFRARQVLKEEIAKNNPEIGKRYGFTKYLKIAIIFAVGFALIGGFTYAMIRLYKANIQKNTFTLADVERELPEEEAKISKEEAIEIMKRDLEILGMNTEFDETKLRLKRDYMSGKNCWEYSDENCKIIINALDGKIVLYSCLNEDKENVKYKYEESILRLGLIEGYELNNREYIDEEIYLEYVKRYGNILNFFQKVSFTIRNDKIIFIGLLDNEYEDTELKVSREEAIEILKEKNIVAVDVELSIEEIDANDKNDNYKKNETIEDVYKNELIIKNSIIRKVWKIKDKNNKIYYVDVYNGKISECNMLERN